MRRPLFPLLASLAVLPIPQAVRAAEVRPLPEAECRDLMRALGTASGLALSTRNGTLSAAAVKTALLPKATTGSACLGAGRATGLREDFARVEDRIAAVLKGWELKPDQQADGPAETIQGFQKGGRHVVFSLATAPPKGRCDDVVLADCKAPRRQWVWTFTATAYRDRAE